MKLKTSGKLWIILEEYRLYPKYLVNEVPGGAPF